MNLKALFAMTFAALFTFAGTTYAAESHDGMKHDQTEMQQKGMGTDDGEPGGPGAGANTGPTNESASGMDSGKAKSN